MAILQALFALIGRSLGRILNALFGWAVRALFGGSSGAERTLLTALVASAALWPLLLVGIVAPRVATFTLTFVPLPRSVPDWGIRVTWMALALLVPALVGVALAAKAPPDAPRESAAMRVARGYPITLGLSIAFWLSFVSVPFRRLATALRGESDRQVTLITRAEGYAQVAERAVAVLNANGFRLTARRAGLWTRAPLVALRALGGAAFRRYVPRHLANFEGPDLQLSVYPSSLLLHGRDDRITLAHGLVVEALTPCDALQTTDPCAQDLERQIRRIWQVLDERPEAHVDSRWLRSRLADVAGDLLHLEVPYDEWQVMYRQALQLGRALAGEPQLLALATQEPDVTTDPHRVRAEHEVLHPRVHGGVEQLSTIELVREIVAKANRLVVKEIELARAEMERDVRAELAGLRAAGIAAIAGVATVNLLLMALVFALTPYLVPWAAALSVAGVMLVATVVTGTVAWRRHVERPLARTRRTLKDDARWAKEQLA